MAQSFLATHGIDLDAELNRLQSQPSQNQPGATPLRSSTLSQSTTSLTSHPLSLISNVSLPQHPSQPHDIVLSGSHITSIHPHDPTRLPREGTHAISGAGALLAPSLCHPHIHLDKAFLLSHPKYRHLAPEQGDFGEAMDLTSRAKANFEETDLLERGQRAIDESVTAGVTHMRAFVEVDAGVGSKCLETGIMLKARAEAEKRCSVQICAFAQLPLFTPSPGDSDGSVIRGLMEDAADRGAVDVLGSTPYVESERESMEQNVAWMVELSAERGVHLDFHLDYNLDPTAEPLVWFVIKTLKAKSWALRTKDKTVVLGHCTRLTLFSDEEWRRLREEIGDLPVSFVGLPTSDLFMMRTPQRTRGTLDIPRLIKDFGLNAAIGVNNIGNAFTPQGSCDPLTLACNGVGVYSAGTVDDAKVLYECVSTRARKAIGFGRVAGESAEEVRVDAAVQIGDRADLLLFASEQDAWRTRREVSEVVCLYDHCRGRRACAAGRLTC